MGNNNFKLILKNLREGLNYLLNAKYFSGKTVVITSIAVFLGAAFLFLTHYYIVTRSPSSPSEKAHVSDPDFQSGYGVGYDLGIRNIPINKNQLQGVSPAFKEGFLAGYTKGKQNRAQDRLATTSRKSKNNKKGAPSHPENETQVRSRKSLQQRPLAKSEVPNLIPEKSAQPKKNVRPISPAPMQTNRPKRSKNHDVEGPLYTSMMDVPVPISVPNPITILKSKSDDKANQANSSSAEKISENSQESPSSSTESEYSSSQAPVIALPTVDHSGQSSDSNNDNAASSDDGAAYDVGYNDGYNDYGYNNQTTAKDDWKVSYQQGYFEGKNNRQDYFTAYDKGYADAQASQYSKPPSQKSIYYNAGYNDGYNAVKEVTSGYQAGLEDAKKGISSPDLSNVTQAYADAYQRGYEEAQKYKNR